MHPEDRIKLLGKYRCPKCKIGGSLFCRLRGRRVKVAGLSDTPIQWPYVAQRAGHGRVSLILCGDLVRAVQRERETAVAYWWGVSIQTVWKWRTALGVGRQTEGTADLQRRGIADHFNDDTRRKVIASTKQPERNAKIAAAKRGKPMPASVKAALQEANIGRPLSEATRQKLSESHKRRGTRPPAAGIPWTSAEDALLGTAKDWEVAERTGRTEAAVSDRRYVLKVAAFTKRNPKRLPPRWTAARDAMLGTMADTALARRLRCSPASVFNRRRQQGIPAFQG